MFKKMFEIAKNKLLTINEIADGLPAPQVTILLTDNNNIYVAINDIEGLICKKLKSENDTKILQMLTMWKDGSIDLSSISFRKELIKMDEYNSNTDIILKGTDGYLIKKISSTMS